MKRSLLILVSIIMMTVLCAVFLISCAENEQPQEERNPMVLIEMQDGKQIKIELFPQYAPKTVENFLKLVDEGYYNGTIFHRIIDNFMVQAGWMEFSNERDEFIFKEERSNIIGEFEANGYKQNTLKHTAGVISMARVGAGEGQEDTEEMLNSASTQFFICTEDKPYLDGEYASFGKVVDAESLGNVIEISHYPTGKFNGMDDFPIKGGLPQITIASIKRLT